MSDDAVTLSSSRVGSSLGSAAVLSVAVDTRKESTGTLVRIISITACL
jgi:hypothetical protein